MKAGKLWGMRRLADGAGRFKMLAVDQRPPIKNLIAQRRDTDDASYEDVCAFKAMLVEELAPHASAALLDPHFALPAAIHLASPGRGLLLTLEDSVFEETPTGRRSSPIDDWSVEKIKRAGGDAVKVLAWYRPDASPDILEHQHELALTIGEACRRFDIPYVFELLVYPFPGAAAHTTDYVEDTAKRADDVVASVAAFAGPEYGIDLFKLESPLPAGAVPDRAEDDGSVQAVFDALGRAAGRPWVMLSAGATQPAFSRILEYAYAAGANGYLAGRAIWWDAGQAFPDLDAMRRRLRVDSVPYMEQLNRMTDEQATPWTDQPGALGPVVLDHAGAGFRHEYQGMEDPA
ncbi:MAG: tagatose 1,6-diphosphate aldolase [Actinomycetia bacterium]|nr:tagatose 1,6-diphosphate aldolase [Actinomycetes bacterium]MCP3910796.1 tagatose 1,6-diphosphate aldolase [Actinomycetes bacterium]